MSAEEENDRDLLIIKKVTSQLAEHFDTVQIFCTRHVSDSEGSVSFKFGSGNWYARFGQITHWVAAQDEDAREEVRKED